MEFGLRDYLLILGGVLILGLLVDGIRRTLNHKRQGLKLDLMAAPPVSPERSNVSPVRPAKRATPVELEPQVDSDPLFDSDDTSQLNLWAGEIKAEAMKSADVNALHQAVTDDRTDSLFENDSSEIVGHPSPKSESSDSLILADDLPVKRAPRVEPTFTVSDDFGSASSASSAPNSIDTNIESRPDDVENEQFAAETLHSEDMAILNDTPADDVMIRPDHGGLFGQTVARILGSFGRAASRTDANEPVSANSSNAIDLLNSEQPTEDRPVPDINDFVMVSLRPSRVQRFESLNLHAACLRAGLRFTSSQTYQRVPLDQDEEPLFSLVNGVEPGLFECEAVSIESPIFFMFTNLATQDDPVFAVNEMISGARAIAREIGGDVFDSSGVLISKAWIDQTRAQASHERLIRS